MVLRLALFLFFNNWFPIPQVSKLQSIKSEIKYSPKMILVKLVGSYNISQLILRISDIKRTKMVCGCACVCECGWVHAYVCVV